MSVIRIVSGCWEFNRRRTLATLDAIEQLPDPAAALAWRPGPGRAHIGWQLMHIGITEELFATERLLGSPAEFPELIPRFRGGSTPDENIPDSATIRNVLESGRQHLLQTVATFSDDDLQTMQQTLDLALELNCEFSNFYSAMAYPGSPLYTQALASGWKLPETWSGYSQHSIDTLPLPTKHVSASQVLWLRDEAFDRLEPLHRVAADTGRSLLELAIAGLVAMPHVGSVIAGASSPEQVRANAAAARCVLDEQTLAALDSLPNDR